VIGTDSRTDLALIKVEGGSDFPFARLSEGKARIGDWVLAVGNPFGLGGTVTAGIVSASGRDIGSGPYDDFIQIDAPVNKGNSALTHAVAISGYRLNLDTASSPADRSLSSRTSTVAAGSRMRCQRCHRMRVDRGVTPRLRPAMLESGPPELPFVDWRHRSE